jgi:hypothetical protein
MRRSRTLIVVAALAPCRSVPAAPDPSRSDAIPRGIVVDGVVAAAVGHGRASSIIARTGAA